MAKAYTNNFYKSKQWLKCREAYMQKRISIDGGMCERCHEELGYIVHHKEYISESNINNPDITLNHDNLEYLCQCCHNKEHIGNIENLKYTFDEQGQPIPISPP